MAPPVAAASKVSWAQPLAGSGKQRERHTPRGPGRDEPVVDRAPVVVGEVEATGTPGRLVSIAKSADRVRRSEATQHRAKQREQSARRSRRAIARRLRPRQQPSPPDADGPVTRTEPVQ